MQVDKISLNNNLSFQSRITPKALKATGDYTVDYWGDLAKYCKESKQIPRLKKLLNKLRGNGDYNILAIECEPRNECGVTNYYIRLYENFRDLKLDRQEEKITSRNNSLGGLEWFQTCCGSVYKLNDHGDSEKIKNKTVEELIMDVLEKIVTKGTAEYKKFFNIDNTNIEALLNKYRR